MDGTLFSPYNTYCYPVPNGNPDPGVEYNPYLQMQYPLQYDPSAMYFPNPGYIEFNQDQFSQDQFNHDQAGENFTSSSHGGAIPDTDTSVHTSCDAPEEHPDTGRDEVSQEVLGRISALESYVHCHATRH